jgi:hypothetical protein
MRSAADAQRPYELWDTRVSWQWTSLDGEVQTVKSDNLFVDYASITQRSKVRTTGKTRKANLLAASVPQTEHVSVPGLLVVPDFVSKAEEDVLMAIPYWPSSALGSFAEHTRWRSRQATSSALTASCSIIRLQMSSVRPLARKGQLSADTSAAGRDAGEPPS